MLRFHPDKVNKLPISEESKKTAEAVFKVISNAYDSQGSNPVAELADELDQLACFRNELVYASNHLYEINEVPHIDDIKDYFVNNRQKDLFANRDEIFSQWKQFYLIKSGSTAALYAAISYFRNSSDGRMKAIKDRIEKFEKEHGKISKGLKIGGKLSLSLIMGAFPLYYLNIFRLASIDENYKSVTDPDGKVRAYYQKVYSHSTYSGNVETKYYIVHFPHGYMKPDEVHDKFMPLRKAQMMAMFSAVASAFGAALPWLV